MNNRDDRKHGNRHRVPARRPVMATLSGPGASPAITEFSKISI